MAVAIFVSEINGLLEPSREEDQTNTLAHDGSIFIASLMETPYFCSKGVLSLVGYICYNEI